MKEYVEYNGFWFSSDTDIKVKSIISNWGRKSQIRLWYGDIETGESWDEENDVCGYIGRSTGSIKIPLLISKSTSHGGGAILDNCIVKIVDTNSKRVLYQHPTFHQKLFSVVGVQVFMNDDVYANCKSELSAKRLCDFMNGKRMCK